MKDLSKAAGLEINTQKSITIVPKIYIYQGIKLIRNVQDLYHHLNTVRGSLT